MTNNTREQLITDINDDFLSTFKYLAEMSFQDVAAQLPELIDLLTPDHLATVGLAATLTVQKYIDDFAAGRYRLIVRSRPNHDVSLLVVNKATSSGSGIGLQLIWRQVMFGTPEGSALRPETAALLRTCVDPALYPDVAAQVQTLYSALPTLLMTEPYARVLQRVAHLPVMLQDLEAQGRYGSLKSIEREARTRLDHLYGQQRTSMEA